MGGLFNLFGNMGQQAFGNPIRDMGMGFNQATGGMFNSPYIANEMGRMNEAMKQADAMAEFKNKKMIEKNWMEAYAGVGKNFLDYGQRAYS